MPFRKNEVLTYQISWSFIPAGEVTLEIKPETTINNTPANHFVMTAETYPIVDLIYKLRERVDAYTDTDITKSYLYKKKQSGRSKRDVTVSFNWQQGVAIYSNFGLQNKPVALQPGTIDPLSALYYIRKTILSPETTIERPVTDGKKLVMGTVKILGKEQVTLQGTTYETLKLEPNMKDVSGVFEKSKNAKMHLWVTTDERQMLVKLKSKVIVGSFVAELIKHNYGEGSM